MYFMVAALISGAEGDAGINRPNVRTEFARFKASPILSRTPASGCASNIPATSIDLFELLKNRFQVASQPGQHGVDRCSAGSGGDLLVQSGQARL
ncbi:hypothetical protein [Amycolatopsis sp. A1MSW2902]|uniref:hypothetical protein n=1 Tax=Amycolatopsis sp. A1MSW2902 TaxID=687413 RepID=UPI00307E1D76